MSQYKKPEILKKKLLTNFLFKQANSFSLDFLAQCPGPPICDQCAVSCFLAGTKVIMENRGPKNIEDVRIGDKVMSYNRRQKKTVPSIVKAITHEVENVYISIDDIVCVTPHHRFWISNVGWIEARNLRKGMKIQTVSNINHSIVSLKTFSKKVEVFNLSLFGTHKNYFANSLLVHNTKCCDVAC